MENGVRHRARNIPAEESNSYLRGSAFQGIGVACLVNLEKWLAAAAVSLYIYTHIYMHIYTHT